MNIPLTACKQYCLAVPKLRDNTRQHRLHAKRYGQGYETPQRKRTDKRTALGKTFGHFRQYKL